MRTRFTLILLLLLSIKLVEAQDSGYGIVSKKKPYFTYDSIGTVQDGKFSGQIKVFRKGKLAFETEYKNGIPHGQVIMWFMGKSWISYNENGKAEGYSLSLNKKGDTTYIGHYSSGIKDGEFIEFFKNGFHKEILYYENGTLLHKKYYYSNGILKAEGQINYSEERTDWGAGSPENGAHRFSDH